MFREGRGNRRCCTWWRQLVMIKQIGGVNKVRLVRWLYR